MPVVIDEHGDRCARSTDADGRVPAALRGLDRFEAREQIVEMLEASGALAEGRAAPARRAPLLPLRHGGRAAPVRSVVREDGAARRARRSQAVRDGAIRILPERWEAVYVNWLDEHPRLEHLAAALVGPSHSGVVLRRVRSAAEHHREPRGRHRVPALRRARCGRTRTCSTPGSRRGSGRSRRSAGRTSSRADLARVLSDRRARDRARRSCSSGSRA